MRNKKNTVLWIIGWILIFPLPLTLVLRKKKFNNVVKILVIVFAWLLYAAIIFGGKQGNERSREIPDGSESEVVVQEKADANNDQKQLTDMEIIRKKGHPTYYGSTAQAHKVWDEIEKGKIHFADEYYGNGDDVLISMGGYKQEEKNEVIRSLGIYFKDPISVEDALSVAREYMPDDVIAKWYEYKDSYEIVPKDEKGDTTAYYFISYRLTDAASDAYYNNEHSYSGTIDVELVSNDNGAHISSVNFQFGTPKFVGFLEKNGLEKKEWNFDFYSNDEN